MAANVNSSANAAFQAHMQEREKHYQELYDMHKVNHEISVITQVTMNIFIGSAIGWFFGGPIGAAVVNGLSSLSAAMRGGHFQKIHEQGLYDDIPHQYHNVIDRMTTLARAVLIGGLGACGAMYLIGGAAATGLLGYATFVVIANGIGGLYANAREVAPYAAWPRGVYPAPA
ncbi:MAG TPA: hypothetical protein VJK48_02295 [Chlamydiales bacterium]|nr:hypothetical protein [Chlamydiales bacterium]